MQGSSLKIYPVYFFFLIEINLIYNVVSVSGVQQSDSITHIYTYVYINVYIIFCRFLSLIGYYKILSIVPCAIQ